MVGGVGGELKLLECGLSEQVKHWELRFPGFYRSPSRGSLSLTHTHTPEPYEFLLQELRMRVGDGRGQNHGFSSQQFQGKLLLSRAR